MTRGGLVLHTFLFEGSPSAPAPLSPAPGIAASDSIRHPAVSVFTILGLNAPQFSSVDRNSEQQCLQRD